MAGNDVVLRFEDVSFEHGHNKPILDEVTFGVRRGSKITIMGQNGAGKSTLVDALIGEIIAQQKTVGSSENVIYNGEVGFVTKAEQESLRDIFMYREVYQHKIARWWPIILLTDDFLLKKSTDMRWSIPIEWKVGLTAISFYNEEATDFGEGLNTSNVCRATITATETSRTFVLSDTFVDITCSKSISSNPDGLTITQFQWWTSDDPTVTTQLLSAALVVRLPEGSDYDIFLRLIAPDGSYGPTFILSVNTELVAPPPPPPSGTGNSTILINTETYFYIKRGATTLVVETSDGVTPIVFDVPDATGTIDVYMYGINPASATLVSNSITYTGVTTVLPFDRCKVSFASVISVGGVEIIIS